MEKDRIVKVFISYSWNNEEFTINLAERLVSNGIDVVLDKWELKEGQDKYAFMEKCVNDADIEKVLIISNREYAEKADKREGGVGDETVIISPEIYGETGQEKFIPIITERDENGDPCLPAYIKSRIYIDLSDMEHYEDEYEKLLRNLYEMPLYQKPKLGSRPAWLEETDKNFSPLKDLIYQLKGTSARNKQESVVYRFKTQYIEFLKTYCPIQDAPSGKEVYDAWMKMKEIRDIYLDYLEALLESECDIGNFLCEWFEELYNTLTSIKTFFDKIDSYNESKLDVFKIYIWELFVCTTVFLRYHNKYGILNMILSNTYFLNDSSYINQGEISNYARFWHHSNMLEEYYNQNDEGKRLITRMGHTLCIDREKKPIYSKEKLAQADLFLYQVFNALDIVNDGTKFRDTYWFPTCYIYVKEQMPEWERMKSKRYCEKMFALFGVSDIDQLKTKISKCIYNNEMGYGGGFGAAPAILNYITIDEIGSLN